MPRPGRALEEGRIYHVYNKTGGSEVPFTDEALASRFVHLLRAVVRRDELLLYAWTLMGNHYHLIVRMGRRRCLVR
jgi:REP element-mobilizing transposase RayT